MSPFLRKMALPVGFVAGLVLLVGVMTEGFRSTDTPVAPRSMMVSGFVGDHGDVGPGTSALGSLGDLRIDRPGRTNIVIWNHPGGAEDACGSPNHFPPGPIMALAEIEVTRIYHLCTEVEEAAAPATAALTRRDEILALVSEFRGLGVPARRLFLAGQATGACAALVALATEPEAVNSAVLLAPTCRAEGAWRADPQGEAGFADILALLAEASRVEALAVAFLEDVRATPDDLRLLTGWHPFTIELFSPRCGADALGAYRGCGVPATGEAVRAYFARRLPEGGAE